MNMDRNKDLANDGNEEMEFRLWEYIDGMGTSTERSALEQLIREHALWKARYEQLLEVHQSLSLVELEQPSLRFSKNVMEEIGRTQISPAARNYINNKVIWGIGIFFLTMIAGFIIYAIS